MATDRRIIPQVSPINISNICPYSGLREYEMRSPRGFSPSLRLWVRHLQGQDIALLCLSREVTNFPPFPKGRLSSRLGPECSVQIWEGRTKRGTPRAGACEPLWMSLMVITTLDTVGLLPCGWKSVLVSTSDKASQVILASKLLAVMVSGHSSSMLPTAGPALAFQCNSSTVLHSSLTCREQHMSDRCCSALTFSVPVSTAVQKSC